MKGANKTAFPSRAEAEQILVQLGILDILSSYGRAEVVGSVALDLIVKRDIDVHLLVVNPDLFSAVYGICHQLLDHPKIRHVRISDYRERHGLKIGIDAFPGASGPWTVDIWVTAREEATGFLLVRELQSKFTPEHRTAILRIKARLHAQGKLRNGISTRIYRAVLTEGVRTPEGFQAAEERR